MDRETETSLVLPDGRIYYGEVKDGLPNGRGRMYIESRDTYDGEFKNGAFHGNGKYYLAGRLSYHGEWRDGVKHGKGDEWFEDGGKYIGTYKDGIPHGEGIFVFPHDRKDGARSYEGGVKNGAPSGKGSLRFDEDFSLQAGFKDGTACAHRRVTAGVGAVFGASDRGARTVKSILVRGRSTKGLRLTLIYSDGKRAKRVLPPDTELGIIADKSGTVYVGGVDGESARHGFGVVYFRGGVCQLESYIHGVPCGSAQGYLPDGVCAEWTYENGTALGVTALFPDGKEATAELIDGKVTLK